MNQNHPNYFSPIRFLVGPTTAQFDIYFGDLSRRSPTFNYYYNRGFFYNTPIIRLPSVGNDDFMTICTWIYQRQSPTFTIDGDLLRLCRLWIAASKLGLWKWMNALMREGMALMQPTNFVVDIDTVKFVYDNTSPTSTLRKFIIAIFCQRATPLSHFFSPQYEQLGILHDATSFLKILEKARHKPLPTDNAAALDHTWWPRYQWRWGMNGRDKNGSPTYGPTFVCGNEASGAWDWSGTKAGLLPLPPHLIWNEHAGVFPDDYFVTEEDAFQTAQDVMMQMENAWAWPSMGLY
jgi:hypothetical protein